MSGGPKVIPWRCRVGFHSWTPWRAGGITEHFDEFSRTIPFKTTRRYYSDCVGCNKSRMRRRKAA
ncbi:hypothetical protein BH769_gp62 [Gordonia phage BritBrat]|uniref:Uncharacterized protein n=1 Tax=Gordonia phage BritBrat TaxID=1838064 RepID=A0A166Y033_9CAUD|nr:hypothetical protein BH769_gp62 [Gordonia phage BritBrat]ANA85265.1 hypothetical protein PBI_BRITBRAT_62 [Gordonia phage BritBrat]